MVGINTIPIISSFFENGIGEIQILFPVEVGDVVRAGALVIANRRADGRVDVGLFRDAPESVGSE